MHPPQTITKKEMELLIALQGGKHTRELKTVKDFDTGDPVRMDRSNLHGYLKSLELRGFVKREVRPIDREKLKQKGGPVVGPKWHINMEMWSIIRQELSRLRGDCNKGKMESDARIAAFWAEVENANREAEWERNYLARQEHYRKIEEANSKKS